MVDLGEYYREFKRHSRLAFLGAYSAPVLVSAVEPMESLASLEEREFNTRLGPTPALGVSPLFRRDDKSAWSPDGSRATAIEGVVHPIRKRRDAIFKDHISLGRTRTNDIQIDDPVISKFHAYFRLDAHGAVESIVDAESTNGTFVNDQRLDPKQAVPLADGDRVRFGKLSFRFCTAEGFYDLLSAIDTVGVRAAMQEPPGPKPSE